MSGFDEPVVVEQTFAVPIETVWRSITDIDLMKQWYFENIPDFKAEIGFQTQFNVKNGDRDFLHLWKVTEVEVQKKIVYDWKFAGYPGESFVAFELFDEGNHTRLKLCAVVKESFDQGIPEFTRDRCKAGWDSFIGLRLKEYLEKP